MDTTAPWSPKTDNIPIKSPVDNKPVPFGGNAAVAFQTQPDIVHEPTSKTIVECSASVMSGGTATSGINSGSVAPTNLCWFFFLILVTLIYFQKRKISIL